MVISIRQVSVEMQLRVASRHRRPKMWLLWRCLQTWWAKKPYEYRRLLPNIGPNMRQKIAGLFYIPVGRLERMTGVDFRFVSRLEVRGWRKLDEIRRTRRVRMVTQGAAMPKKNNIIL